MAILDRVSHVLGISPTRRNQRARWWPVGLLALLMLVAIYSVGFLVPSPILNEVRATEVDATAVETEKPVPPRERSKRTGTISAKDAISVMKSLEAKIPVLQWKAKWNGARLKDGYDLKSIVEKNTTQTEVESVFDPVSGHFRCKAKGTYKWVDGLAPTGSSFEEYSFDGEQYRTWKRMKPGNQLPTAGEVRARGFVGKDLKDIWWRKDQDYIKTSCMMTGLAYMPPYFWDADKGVKTLSSLMQAWIEEGRDVSIVEDTKDKWTITVPGLVFGDMSVSYDLGKGGVVTEAKWVDTRRNRELVHLFVELQKVDAKLWLPKSITRVARVDKFMSRVDITDVKKVPKVGPKTFRATFPKGCCVTDYINKSRYVEGSPELKGGMDYPFPK